MLHLRDINPYVAAGLIEAGSGRTAAIARMSASYASHAGNPACGVSAFAFQVCYHNQSAVSMLLVYYQYATISVVLSILNNCVSLSVGIYISTPLNLLLDVSQSQSESIWCMKPLHIQKQIFAVSKYGFIQGAYWIPADHA